MARGDHVFLEKRCPEHGAFSAVVWRGAPAWDAWAGPARPASPPTRPSTAVRGGCPTHCGLCPSHRQRTCCMLVEVTRRCDLGCRFCFAAAGGGGHGADPAREEVEGWLRLALERSGPVNVQLSGGEPTLRDDLPELVRLSLAVGHPFVQLNTNGLRLGREPGYARRLAEAGLGCVFLQFDGLGDDVHRRLRGAPLEGLKAAAIARCAEAGLGVVLVPTLVPGVNTDQVGALVTHALALGPAVRGVHFQPVSYFGRFPRPPADEDRVTLPEVMAALERQTDGLVEVAHLRPPAAENAHCSFSGTFARSPGGLRPMAAGASCCGPARPEAAPAARGCCRPGREAEQARQAVALRWAHPGPEAPAPGDGLDAFLAQARRSAFSISGMAFQDAWTLDLERLRECHVHVLAPDRRIVPFCAYQLTDLLGRPLHRPGAGAA